MDVSRQAVHKWEKDQSKPDTANLVALSELLDIPADSLIRGKTSKEPDPGKVFFTASLIPLFILIICGLAGLFSGEYTDMVTIPISEGIRVGIPFLMYGRSPAAIALVIISIVSLILFVVLIFLGIYSNKRKK